MFKKTVAILLGCASLSWACEKGWTPTPEGVCMEGSIQTVVPSDEKPPKDKMPSYQREGIAVVEAQGKMADDIQADNARESARLEGVKNCQKKFGKGGCPDLTAGKRP